MKRLLMILIVMFTIVSCKNKEKISDTKITGFDFNEVVLNDNEFVKTLSGNDSIRFCEAQGKFMGSFNKESKEYEVIWMMTVFQVDTMVYTLTHDTLSEDPIISKYNDIWLGDLYSSVETNIDLKSAIDSLKKSEIAAPESPFFVLRKPITAPPFPKHPLYIFGSVNKGAVSIDSETGEVTKL